MKEATKKSRDLLYRAEALFTASVFCEQFKDEKAARQLKEPLAAALISGVAANDSSDSDADSSVDSVSIESLELTPFSFSALCPSRPR
jgi:hypothetical protein